MSAEPDDEGVVNRPVRLTVSGAGELVVQLRPAHAGADPAAESAVDSTGAGLARADFPPQLLRSRPADAASGRRRLEVVVDGWRFEVVAEDARQATLRERAVHAAAAQGISARLVVRAQIPGRVTRLWVGAGDQVEAGQRLLAIEAMKMENEVRAPRAGTVDSIAIAEGELVELNDELLTLA